MQWVTTIGVRDQFRLGGLRSVARIFSPLHARKSSGFARILQSCFLARNGYLKNYANGRGCSPSPPPPPHTHTHLVRLWLYNSMMENRGKGGGDILDIFNLSWKLWSIGRSSNLYSEIHVEISRFNLLTKFKELKVVITVCACECVKCIFLVGVE